MLLYINTYGQCRRHYIVVLFFLFGDDNFLYWCRNSLDHCVIIWYWYICCVINQLPLWPRAMFASIFMEILKWQMCSDGFNATLYNIVDTWKMTEWNKSQSPQCSRNDGNIMIWLSAQERLVIRLIRFLIYISKRQLRRMTISLDN